MKSIVSPSDEENMIVKEQILDRGISNPRVLAALEHVPREHFVPAGLEHLAYADGPLPIGFEQTISQPYIVALMTELLDPQADQAVLEVGTGSGYQAAVLAELARQVYSIEILEPLAVRATARLEELGYWNVAVRWGDGYQGWSEAAPFDGIVVTAAADTLPQDLVDQLKPGGRLVIPLGPQGGAQSLFVFEKLLNGDLSEREIAPVHFVPFIHSLPE